MSRSVSNDGSHNVRTKKRLHGMAASRQRRFFSPLVGYLFKKKHFLTLFLPRVAFRTSGPPYRVSPVHGGGKNVSKQRISI